MDPQNFQTRSRSRKTKSKKTRKLCWYQLFLLKIASWMLRLWTRTLRFELAPEVRAIIESSPPPTVVILWHNRLFVVPEFYRRHVHNRRLAAIVSTSSSGAWLSGLFEQLSIKPIRGSRKNRGMQAFREMLNANKEGYDVGVTPDGSRGPIYEMKTGAAKLAMQTNAPIVLLSYNFQQAFRLNTWDRFYIPWPFSNVRVQMNLINNSKKLLGEDGAEVAKVLKARLDAMTEDANDDFFAVVI